MVFKLQRFLFPSNGKDFQNMLLPPPSAMGIRCFYSLQTGRTSRTQENFNLGINSNPVSIPFKREGLPELFSTRFPSVSMYKVSIPFKREGLPELFAVLTTPAGAWLRFYSLQTGRTSRTRHYGIVCIQAAVFLFPSNGKDFQNSTPYEPSHSKC